MDENGMSMKAEWEKRGGLHGAGLKSVLFKGLPDIVNEHVDAWHKRAILANIRKQEHMRLLDAGCGYGRISLSILEKFPDAEMTGMDAADIFVALYRETTKRDAVQGTLMNIPPELGKFDYVVCVTVLMYTGENDVAQAMKNMMGRLKPGGRLLLIEPQNSMQYFLRLCGLVDIVERFLPKSGINTGGRYFKKQEIPHQVNTLHYVIESRCGMPFTTLCIFPVSVLAKLCPAAARPILKLLSLLDAKFGGSSLPSLYYCYEIRNPMDR